MIVGQGAVIDLTTGFRAEFQSGFAGVETTWQRIATLVPSNTRTNHFSWLGQWKAIREWIGDRQFNDLKKFDYSIENKLWEDSLEVPRVDIEDDQFGQFAPLAAGMGMEAALHPDRVVWDTLTQGEVELAYDGKPFFAADHPIGRNSTTPASNLFVGDNSNSATPWYVFDTSRPLKPLIYQNRTSAEFIAMTSPNDEHVFRTDKFLWGIRLRMNVGFGFWQMAIKSKDELDKSGFRAVRKLMRDFNSDEGNPLGLKPTLLVVGSANEGAAKDTIKAERDAAGATNTEQNAVEVMVVDWLP